MDAKSYKITAPILDDDDFARISEPTSPGPNPAEWGMLQGLQQLSHVYGGTVDPVTIRDRRRRNKTARRSRRINHLAAQR